MRSGKRSAGKSTDGGKSFKTKGMEREHVIFISYRKVDGQDLANWVFNQLKGKSQLVTVDGQSAMVQLMPVMDITIPGGAAWQNFLDGKLAQASSLLVVCSPSTLAEKRGEPDWFYHEIRWWIENRKDTPPILIALSAHKHHYVPYLLADTWTGRQVVEIEHETIKRPAKRLQARIDMFMDCVIAGLTAHRTAPGKSAIVIYPEMSIARMKGIFAWEKDRFGCYIFVNENYARAAGADSPAAMIGKTDAQMPWRSLAKMFQQGDREVMKGEELRGLGVYEKEIMWDKVADIFVHEEPLYDSAGQVRGVKGFFVDVSGHQQIIQSQRFKIADDGISLGPEFGDAHLDLTEIAIFQALVLNKPERKILSELKLSKIVYQGVLASLQQKLQCTGKEAMLVTAVRSGLPLRLFGAVK